mmetsp:Transcript_3114/g.6243  ORF Transcript_3114/g.6243 Transcript_3114/m.6243 type:complete len:258 (-) Transcript_3114:185-958(-)
MRTTSAQPSSRSSLVSQHRCIFFAALTRATRAIPVSRKRNRRMVLVMHRAACCRLAAAFFAMPILSSTSFECSSFTERTRLLASQARHTVCTNLTAASSSVARHLSTKLRHFPMACSNAIFIMASAALKILRAPSRLAESASPAMAKKTMGSCCITTSRVAFTSLFPICESSRHERCSALRVALVAADHRSCLMRFRSKARFLALSRAPIIGGATDVTRAAEFVCGGDGTGSELERERRGAAQVLCVLEGSPLPCDT